MIAVVHSYMTVDFNVIIKERLTVTVFDKGMQQRQSMKRERVMTSNLMTGWLKD